ncbi:MAG: hypothetical protein MUF30_06805 [Burkholderiales bacterium]|jgi:hypothetical protein|nr:hypothetical protein [Burkholderiales bacterium]
MAVTGVSIARLVLALFVACLAACMSPIGGPAVSGSAVCLDFDDARPVVLVTRSAVAVQVPTGSLQAPGTLQPLETGSRACLPSSVAAFAGDPDAWRGRIAQPAGDIQGVIGPPAVRCPLDVVAALPRGTRLRVDGVEPARVRGAPAAVRVSTPSGDLLRIASSRAPSAPRTACVDGRVLELEVAP